MAENIRIVDGYNPTSTEVHCPGCGGTIGISYDPATMKMVCPFCGLSTQLPQPEEGTTVDELDFNSAMQRANVNWGRIKKLIVCSNCGGETLYDAEQITGACPFCGSTSVAPAAENEQIMAPGSVIPFSVTPEMAEQCFMNFLRRKHCVSKKIYNCKLENLVGIYLPFWTFDAYTITSYITEMVYSRDCVKYYKGVFGYTFDDIVIFASAKYRNPYIKRVQDFDFTKVVPYSPEYLAGFPAERYTIGLNGGWERAKITMPSVIHKAIKKHEQQLRGGTAVSVRQSTNYYNVKYRYLLAPMYLAHFTFKNKTYQVAINGQTGKTHFDVPTYILKMILLSIAVGVLLLGLYILGMFLLKDTQFFRLLGGR
ncbi:MAG: hypothetical protein IKH76_08545 [Clostridiales bacterium]|nr:hypothetical protein [Clostridiales bacterium]